MRGRRRSCGRGRRHRAIAFAENHAANGGFIITFDDPAVRITLRGGPANDDGVILVRFQGLKRSRGWYFRAALLTPLK
jgi:hypothetical protein